MEARLHPLGPSMAREDLHRGFPDALFQAGFPAQVLPQAQAKGEAEPHRLVVLAFEDVLRP